MSEEYLKGGGLVVIPNNHDLTNKSNTVNRLPKYWDRDYINAMIERIPNHRHKMLMLFLWMTGVRISEAVLLRTRDADYQNYTLTIRWLKSRKYEHRVIPLHPSLRDVMQVYTATNKADDLIFPMSRQRAWQLVKRYFAGHPHQFRHSFAVNWLRSGGDIIVLSRMLGHAKIQSTMEYLKIVPVDQGKELLKIQFR